MKLIVLTNETNICWEMQYTTQPLVQLKYFFQFQLYHAWPVERLLRGHILNSSLCNRRNCSRQHSDNENVFLIPFQDVTPDENIKVSAFATATLLTGLRQFARTFYKGVSATWLCSVVHHTQKLHVRCSVMPQCELFDGRWHTKRF